MLQSGLGVDSVASFGVCRVFPRPLVIDASEYHDGSCEALMPIDGDVIIHVAPASPGTASPARPPRPISCPRGPWSSSGRASGTTAPSRWVTESVSCLVALPERLYARDCRSIIVPEEDRIRISGRGLEAAAQT